MTLQSRQPDCRPPDGDASRAGEAGDRVHCRSARRGDAEDGGKGWPRYVLHRRVFHTDGDQSGGAIVLTGRLEGAAARQEAETVDRLTASRGATAICVGRALTLGMAGRHRAVLIDRTDRTCTFVVPEDAIRAIRALQEAFRVVCGVVSTAAGL